jgi:single-stranded-DNA-specific exonuclease
VIESREWLCQDLPLKDYAVSFPLLIKKLLSARGFTADEDVKTFLSASLRHMTSPYTLKDMNLAVDRLVKAFENEEHILVYGDFDLDGSSGLALLVDGLKDFGFHKVTYFQPKRLTDGYGLHAKFIEAFKAQGVDVILTVDLGITAIDAATECRRLGVDLIITDHHQPQEFLPNALAVVNPNRIDCTSGLGYLCGAGVGYYLLLALKMKWFERGVPHKWDPKASLDLLLIAILTDMVPLKKENRALAKHGLTQFQNTQRPALQFLLKSLKMVGRPLSGQDVAIGFAPKLNALSRLEQGVLPVDLFLEKDIAKAAAITSQALKMNEERKSLQAEAEQEAAALHVVNGDQSFAFVYSENFHKGVIGLVATRLTQNLQIPSFVCAVIEGHLVGSARAPDTYGISLLEIFSAASECLEGFGGHKSAAGFQMQLGQVDAFRNKLAEILKNPPSPNLQVRYDTEAELKDLNDETLEALDALGPFGTDFPVPVFLVKNLRIATKTVMRGGHIRFSFTDNSKNRKTALLFSPPPYATYLGENQDVDVLVELQWNYYNGRKTTQLLVKDIRSRI